MRTNISRIFLVGSARSGTTLLQALLAAHPEITSYPESHFFRSLAARRRWARALGIASRRARPCLAEFARAVTMDETRRVPRTAILVRQYVDAFVRLLDEVAEGEGKRAWVEKTPAHLWHLDDIENLVPDAKFVHLVRDGTDVVASQYDVTHRYPDQWGRPRDVDECIDRWLNDVRITLSRRDDPRHRVVRYERLVAEPRDVLQTLCGFLGVEFSNEMLTGHADAAERLVRENEAWKQGRSAAIERPRSKFDELFDEHERSRIAGRVAAVDLTALDSASPQSERKTVRRMSSVGQ